MASHPREISGLGRISPGVVAGLPSFKEPTSRTTNMNAWWAGFLSAKAGIASYQTEPKIAMELKAVSARARRRETSGAQAERQQLEGELAVPRLRMAAIGGLVKIRDAQSFGPLSELLGQELPKRTYTTVLKALALIGMDDSYGWGEPRYVSPIKGHFPKLVAFIERHIADAKLVKAAGRALAWAEAGHIVEDAIFELQVKAGNQGHADSVKALSGAFPPAMSH